MTHDIEIQLEDPSAGLAALADAVGRAGVSLEGGGMFVLDGVPVAHFLVDDAAAASHAVESGGLGRCRVNDVAMLHLDQDTPGQLGACIGRVAASGIRLRAQYSDHAGALVLVPEPEDVDATRSLAATWEAGRGGPNADWIARARSRTKSETTSISTEELMAAVDSEDDA